MPRLRDRVRFLQEIFARVNNQLTQDEIDRAFKLYAQVLQDNLQGIRPNAETSLTEAEAEWLLQALERMGAGGV
jgi:hypothetical protein